MRKRQPFPPDMMAMLDAEDERHRAAGMSEDFVRFCRRNNEWVLSRTLTAQLWALREAWLDLLDAIEFAWVRHQTAIVDGTIVIAYLLVIIAMLATGAIQP